MVTPTDPSGDADDQQATLPPGWEWTTLGEVAALNQRHNDRDILSDDSTVTFVPMAAIDAETGVITDAEERPLSQVRVGYTGFRDGDVLFAKITPCMENGKAAIANQLHNGRGFGSTEFHVLRPTSATLSEWLFYFVRQHRFRRDARASFTGTAGQLRVPVSFLHSSPLPLAPLAEQQRIVAAIEAQFSRLDIAVAALKRAQVRLKRYRAAVLKAAVEGELTAEWRAAHPAAEPAPALLQRILRERRAAWERAELDRYARTGKTPPKGWQDKYQEPAMPDTTELPELPKGWCWAAPHQLASPDAYSLAIGPFGSNLKVEDYRPLGVRLIFVRNIRSGDFDGPGLHYVTEEKARELRPHEVAGGDILITKMGDPPGDARLYPLHEPRAIITADCIKWRLHPILVERLFFVHAMNSWPAKIRILAITKGVAQLKVSLERFRRIALPLPPLAEQEQIVSEVEGRLSVVTHLEGQVEAALKRAERLRQSILQQAFSGRLVPQDPSDEPASALLERIRAARAGAGVAHQGARPGRPTRGQGQGRRPRGNDRHADADRLARVAGPPLPALAGDERQQRLPGLE